MKITRNMLKITGNLIKITRNLDEITGNKMKSTGNGTKSPEIDENLCKWDDIMKNLLKITENVMK